MATEEGTEPTSPIDEVMEDIRRELVQRVAATDRDANRDVCCVNNDIAKIQFSTAYGCGPFSLSRSYFSKTKSKYSSVIIRGLETR